MVDVVLTRLTITQPVPTKETLFVALVAETGQRRMR